MASTATKLLTADEFWQLPEQPDVREELVDGEVVELPGAGGFHATLLLHIFDLLRQHVFDNDLGLVYPDGLTYRLASSPDILRIPDISFIASTRIPDDWPPLGYVETTPGLVVEIVSPGNSAADLHRRTRDFIAAGTDIVWIVWPEDRSVTEHRGSLDAREFHFGDTLDGGDVLPGFSVQVADLFDVER